MYKTRKRLSLLAVNILVIFLYVVMVLTLLPGKTSEAGIFGICLVGSVFFIIVTYAANVLRQYVLGKVRKQTIESGETLILTSFIEKLRFCYTLDDFYGAISEYLEKQADCSCLLVDRKQNYILYNSPNRITTTDSVREKLFLSFSEDWKDSFNYFDRHLGVTTNSRKSRGFFIVFQNIHLYVFCRYTRLFDPEVYNRLFEEFKRFITRSNTLSTLQEIASTTKEWEQLANTQQSFLPVIEEMPKIPKLQIATYFRPLVNVSGDYYSVLPISQSKTLLMLGDVSGKGLPAALIMGLVMNTVKIIENKEDLVGVLGAIDKAIKGMHLQDKYTVIFLGIVDTDEMKIRYINASMSDPVILSPAPDGYRMKPLTSNASVVGILEMDLENIKVAEKRLFRGDTILMATDGVSEVMDDSGVELGDTEIFKKTLQSGAAKSPKEFVNDIVNLIMEYNGGKKLHDDVTMMIAKVGY
ncbi:MAG: SpoIIE family protein phosphatase [Treponema sp.]|nr:SpoIIE family protein phosphatase [Treponema sp.]